MDIEIAIGATAGVVGSVMWVVANVLYLRYARQGTRGFSRFAAFWVGWPGTFVSMFLVAEGSAPKERELSVEEEEAVLLSDIRRERLSRGGDSPDQGAQPPSSRST